MAKLRHLIIFLLPVILLIFATACGDAESALGSGGLTSYGGEESEIDADEDGIIDEAPEEVNDLFTPDDLQAFRDEGLPIFLGLEPVDVTGEYIANTLRIAYDDEGVSGSFDDYVYDLFNQTEQNSIVLSYAGVSGDESLGNSGFIAGNGTCFSIFAIIKDHNDQDNCDYERNSIYSGCIDSSGSISGFAFGFVISNLQGDCTQTLPLGHMRIIEETDGQAACH